MLHTAKCRVLDTMPALENNVTTCPGGEKNKNKKNFDADPDPGKNNKDPDPDPAKKE